MGDWLAPILASQRSAMFKIVSALPCGNRKDLYWRIQGLL
jgi:hypothetical protein